MAVIQIGGVLTARAHEKVTDLSSSAGFSAASYALTTDVNSSSATTKVDTRPKAEEVIVTVETADIRWTIDGTTPVVTATSNGTGHIASAGDVLTITGYDNIRRFRAINAVAASGAMLKATFMFRR
jgi:hypothetical protein